ncbi:MAG: hypothetical protein WBJ81_06690 [Rickettsiales bacterium]
MGDCIEIEVKEANTIIIGCVQNQNSKTSLTNDDLKQIYTDTKKNQFLYKHADSIKLMDVSRSIGNGPEQLTIGQSEQSSKNYFQLQTVDSSDSQLIEASTALQNGAISLFKEINKTNYVYVFATSEFELKEECKKEIIKLNLPKEIEDSYLAKSYKDLDDFSFEEYVITGKEFGPKVHALRHGINIAELDYNQKLISGDIDNFENAIVLY